MLFPIFVIYKNECIFSKIITVFLFLRLLYNEDSIFGTIFGQENADLFKQEGDE